MLAPVSTNVTILVVAAAGYLLGSVPVANVVARLAGSGDLRELGDHNPGYWNAKEQLGRRPAVFVFVGDAAKGTLAAAVGLALAGDGEWWMAYVGGGAAMVGHAWPVFARFSGGRSVLTFAGAAVVFAPGPAAIAIGVTIVVSLIRRDFAWGARAGFVALPVVQLALDGPYRTAATGVLMTFIGVRFLQAALADR